MSNKMLLLIGGAAVVLVYLYLRGRGDTAAGGYSDSAGGGVAPSTGGGFSGGMSSGDGFNNGPSPSPPGSRGRGGHRTPPSRNSNGSPATTATGTSSLIRPTATNKVSWATSAISVKANSPGMTSSFGKGGGVLLTAAAPTTSKSTPAPRPTLSRPSPVVRKGSLGRTGRF